MLDLPIQKQKKYMMTEYLEITIYWLILQVKELLVVLLNF